MAEAVSFVLHQLSILLTREGNLLGGLRGEFQCIKDELGHMRAFLMIAEAKEEEDLSLQEWIRQVREAAYDTEDVHDEFMLHFSRHRTGGFYGCVRRIFASIKNLRARRRIATEIQSLKKRITNISEAHRRYQFDQYGTSEPVSIHGAASRALAYDRDDALLVEEEKLVGIEEPKKQLISHLLDDESHLKVVSVVGMGGVGKTTLVKRVYEDANVRKQFQIRAWVAVSQTCDITALLIDLIQQFYQAIQKPIPQPVESMKRDGLKSFIKDFLQGKRYVIVFDDVWHINFWNTIKFALPEGGCGNRVMVTTRIADVASASCVECHGYIYPMKHLSFEKSWTLFCRKTFKDNCCPTHLENICKRILSKCKGLPLGIVVISGVLALKDEDKIDEWERVYRNLGAELEGTGKLDKIKRIISLSYNELPYYLKTCLMHLSVFPEDSEILCIRLVRMWSAERFVQGIDGMRIEEVGWVCLNELISRNLIQVIDSYSDGKPRYCCIHDLLREIILSKSREQNIVSITTGQYTRWPENVRRLGVHSLADNTTLEGACFKHIRSLITFGSVESVSKSLLSKLLDNGCRLLKVLDLEGAYLEEIPDEVFTFFNLNYLNLSRTGIKSVPKSIGKLQNLEYLDVSINKVIELPIEILKLQKLRALYVYEKGGYSEDYLVIGFKAPYNMGELVSLNYLAYIDADTDGDKSILREIKKLTQLRTLRISKLRRKDGRELCFSLELLTNLEILSISAVEKDEIIDLDYPLSSSSSLQYLQSLYLWGRLEKVPRWMHSLQGLTQIFFVWSELRDDPIESLQHLPNLKELVLVYAYQGDGLCFKAGGFLNLKRLSLQKMKVLRRITIEVGALPHLQFLGLRKLPLLEELPCGIQQLAQLQELRLVDMSKEFVSKLQKGGDDEQSEEYRSRISHVSEVYIGFWTGNPWQNL